MKVTAGPENAVFEADALVLTVPLVRGSAAAALPVIYFTCCGGGCILVQSRLSPCSLRFPLLCLIFFLSD